MAELLYPQFACEICLRVISVCRLCESAERIGDLIYSRPGNDYLFWLHLYNEHKDSRYINWVDGRVFLVGYNIAPDFSKCLESHAFVWKNPHVLCIDTFCSDRSRDGSDHKSDCRDRTRDVFDYLAENERAKLTILINHDKYMPRGALNEAVDEYSSRAISRIINGDNVCWNCGMEYDAFPTFEIFSSHIDSCTISAEDVIRKNTAATIN